MKVYVVMANDFPDSVFTFEKKADAYAERMRKEDQKVMANKINYARVHWRVYEFILDEKAR